MPVECSYTATFPTEKTKLSEPSGRETTLPALSHFQIARNCHRESSRSSMHSAATGMHRIMMKLIAVVSPAALTGCARIAMSPTQLHANDYAGPAEFRGALDAYHSRAPEEFREACTNVMRKVLWAIAELDGADYATGERTRLVRERTLAHLSAANSSWQGVSTEHLKTFEKACDDHWPAAIPTGPGNDG